MQFDRTKPYGEIVGDFEGARYQQAGCLFGPDEQFIRRLVPEEVVKAEEAKQTRKIAAQTAIKVKPQQRGVPERFNPEPDEDEVTEQLNRQLGE